MTTSRTHTHFCLLTFASCLLTCGSSGAADGRPVLIRTISLVPLGRPGFSDQGKKLPRAPIHVIPYAGAFKLTMDVDSIKPGRSIKWIAWFGEAVRKGYTETDDAALYRSKAGPKTTPLASIAGFEDRFRGEPTRAIPKVGMTVTPSPDHTGEAYSFHVAARGHNSAVYPLWMRPVTVGGNILYATVHQRFVYHLMFRLEKRHFARYELRTDAQKVARMMLPYTILIIDDDGTRKRLLAVYRGEVSVNGFPFEQLRRGAGVTVEALKTVPRRIYPEEAPQ